MTTLAFIDQIGSWWHDLSLAKQLFYGIGLLAGIVSLILAILSFIGLEHGADVDVPDAGGGGIFSIKPLTGFFLGFGWVGGLVLDAGKTLAVALFAAFGAGAIITAAIIVLIRAIYSLKSDGTVRVDRAVGAIGTVYVSVPPRRSDGGQVVVNFSGRQETFSALNASDEVIPSGDKIRVTEVIDSRTVLVERL